MRTIADQERQATVDEMPPLWHQLRESRERHRRRGAAAEIAYWTIRDAIRQGQIQPGDRLIELDLAGALEMSRTPVREALRRLAVERLVERAPSRGFVVPIIELADLIEIYELREVLEGLAARRAAHTFGASELTVMAEAIARTEDGQRTGDMTTLWEGSNRFHRMLRGNGSSRVAQQLTLLLDSHSHLRLHEFAPERVGSAVAEHRAIYEAIAARQPDEAERLARLHSRYALQAQLHARHLADER